MVDVCLYINHADINTDYSSSCRVYMFHY